MFEMNSRNSSFVVNSLDHEEYQDFVIDDRQEAFLDNVSYYDGVIVISSEDKVEHDERSLTNATM